jgi:4-amino-4-deoxy-L-arabinose transferase-like glycosyltransferase
MDGISNQSMKKKYLFIILLVTFFLCLHGLNWGRVQEWNPDQMGFRGFSLNNFYSFDPHFFLKPPFHSYLNYFLAELPASKTSAFLHLSTVMTRQVVLLWSRLLTVSLFLGSSVLLFYLIKKYNGFRTAIICTVLYATSAGVLSYTHFLTADIPVLFWSVVTFCCAEQLLTKQTVKLYALVGFLIGITTATKYNGLLIVSAFLVFHFLAERKNGWKSIVLNWKLPLSALLSIFGFLLANPFAILDYSFFSSDMHYLIVTEEMFKFTEKNGSYFSLPIRIAGMIGYPVLILFTATLLYFLFSKKKKITPLFWASGSMVLAYGLLFGNYPTSLKRYILVLIPFFFLLCSEALSFLLSKIQTNKRFLFGFYAIIFCLVIYNSISSLMVGRLFLEDNRMRAQVWAMKNIEPLSTIERSTYVPEFNLLYENPPFISEEIPGITGRIKTFTDAKPNDPIIAEKSRRHEGSDDAQWFKKEELTKRNPDYIAVSSSDYFYGFMLSDYRRDYPEVHQFFVDLLEEKFNYKIVFDYTDESPPWYLYPSEVDFLNSRLVILKRKNPLSYDEKLPFSLTPEEATSVIDSIQCEKFEVCLSELEQAFSVILERTHNPTAKKHILDALKDTQLLKDGKKYEFLFSNRTSLYDFDKNVFFAQLFYHIALENPHISDETLNQDVETSLLLSTYFAPYWSYFDDELMNYYLEHGLRNKAKEVALFCTSYEVAKKDCVKFFLDYHTLKRRYYPGFLRNKMMEIIQNAKQMEK